MARLDREGALPPLTEKQKQEFVRNGFVHVANVVPPRLVARARRAINNSLGSGIDPRQLVRFSNQTFCPELREDPRLLRLATTPEAWSHVRALLGDHRVVRPKACQIALRFPLPEGTSRRVTGGHIDGYHTPRNGVPDDGTVRSFTLLLGILLSDVARALKRELHGLAGNAPELGALLPRSRRQHP